jgi:DNA-binding response OmpR family regulator
MLSCLIAEDEAITGMALAEAAEDANFRVLGPFSRYSAALEALDQVTPDVAILDVKLKDGPSVTLALALQDRSVPFVVYSGHLRTEDMPLAFAEAPWVEKPATPTEVLAALRPVLLQSGQS